MAIHRWLSVSMFVCVLGLCAGSVAEAQDQNTHYRIRARHSDKCLDVAGVSISNGARLQQWGCAGWIQNNQIFNIVPAGAGIYRIVPIHSVKCLDITGTSSIPPHNPVPFTDNTALAQQWDCNTAYPQVNQTFYMVTSEIPNYFRIKPVHSGRCLDVSNVSMADGALVQQWDCAPWSQDNQLWRLESVGPRIPRTNVQSLGYFGKVPTANVGQISDHMNFLWAYDFPEDTNNAAAAGMTTIVPLNTRHVGLFHLEAGKSSYIDPAYKTNWDSFVATYGPLLANASAFYIMDEPYHNGHALGYSDQQIFEGLRLAADYIKLSYSTKKIAYVEGIPYIGIEGWTNPPDSIDWVGFDCYPSWDNCWGNSIPNHVNNLKTVLKPHQKIVLAPWASFFRPAGHFNEPPTQDEINHRIYLADRYVELALTEPRVIALFNWTMPFITTEQEMGPFVSPELMAKWRFLGRALGFGTP